MKWNLHGCGALMKTGSMVQTIVAGTLVCGLAFLCGCGKKQESATPAATTPTNQPTVMVNQPIVAPVKYTDAKKQSRFTELFNEYVKVFRTPDVNAPVRVEKKSGLRVDGDFVRFSDGGVVITSQDGPVMIAQTEMTEESATALFVSAFGEAMAEKQMNKEAVNGNRVSQRELFFKPPQPEVLEVRRFNVEHINPRYGPGQHFAVVEESELFRGQNVYVAGEEEEWIFVKTSADAPEGIGWIPRFSSFMSNPENKAAVTREVQKLIDNGIIIDVNPKRNEALVDLYKWRIADISSAEGMSRLLAIHCGQQKGVRLYWVEMKDALSGKKLADYSESKGFKVY